MKRKGENAFTKKGLFKRDKERKTKKKHDIGISSKKELKNQEKKEKKEEMIYEL